jgi:ribosomal protein S18 acetylase RimI-like enzyme
MVLEHEVNEALKVGRPETDGIEVFGFTRRDVCTERDKVFLEALQEGREARILRETIRSSPQHPDMCREFVHGSVGFEDRMVLRVTVTGQGSRGASVTSLGIDSHSQSLVTSGP